MEARATRPAIIAATSPRAGFATSLSVDLRPRPPVFSSHHVKTRSSRLARCVAIAATLLAFGASAGLAQAQDDPSPAEPGEGQADDTQPEDLQATQRARQNFLAGIEHFRAHRYRDAIQSFQVAAQLVPSADLWFNIARSHEELSEYELAIEHYQRYLRDRVDPPDREQVEAHIESLRERAEAARAAAQSAPTEGTLRLSANRDGSEVQLDGASAGQTPWDQPRDVTPGRHRLAVLREGYVPFATTYAAFAARRAYDFIANAVAEPRLPVKIVCALPGLTSGHGPSHQSPDDLAIFRALPNMTVIFPCDAVQATKATLAAAEYDGPVYLRLGRNAVPVITSASDPFMIGRANVMRQGDDVTIIANGIMVGMALQAAETLAAQQGWTLVDAGDAAKARGAREAGRTPDEAREAGRIHDEAREEFAGEFRLPR